MHAPTVVVELAKRQHGVVARRQLLSAGVSSSAVGRMTTSGWLTAVHPGVYLVAGHPPTANARWMAAVLAGGPDAVLSHASAGSLWEIFDHVPGPTHLTLPGARHRRRGIVFHRALDLDRASTVHHRIPVTTPSRTILDLAAVLSARRLEQALEAAERNRLLDVSGLMHLCGTSRGRKGTGRLLSLSPTTTPSRRPAPSSSAVSCGFATAPVSRGRP